MLMLLNDPRSGLLLHLLPRLSHPETRKPKLTTHNTKCLFFSSGVGGRWNKKRRDPNTYLPHTDPVVRSQKEFFQMQEPQTSLLSLNIALT